MILDYNHSIENHRITLAYVAGIINLKFKIYNYLGIVFL